MRHNFEIILIAAILTLVFVSCSQKINVAGKPSEEINRVPSYARNSPDLNPSTFDERIHEGLILYRSNKYIQARNHFVAIKNDYPKEWSVYYYLGLVNCKLGEFDKALHVYDIGLELAPSDAKVRSSVYRAIAECYEQQDQLKNAEKNFRMALDLFPESTSAKRGLDRIKHTRQNMR